MQDELTNVEAVTPTGGWSEVAVGERSGAAKTIPNDSMRRCKRGWKVAGKEMPRPLAAWGLWIVCCVALLLALPRTALAVPAKDPNRVDELVGAECRSHTFEPLTSSSIPSAGPVGDCGGAVSESPVSTGNADDPSLVVQSDASRPTSYIPLVMIAVGFEGQPYDESLDWGERVFGGARSVTQYYHGMSFGEFTFLPVQETSAFGVDGNTNAADKANDGVVHVSLGRQKTKAWYVTYDPDADAEMLSAFSDAIVAAGAYVDFASYDTNGDGAIQTSELAVGFVVTGRDAAAYLGSIKADQELFIWPHAGTYADFVPAQQAPVVDGVVVNSYIAIAEFAGPSKTSIAEESIGTLCHELGHYLGLPDLYHTGSSPLGPWGEYSVSYLSLMDYGAYGTDLEGNNQPFSLDIWSRARLGWVEPTTLTGDEEEAVSIAGSLSSGDVPVAYRIDVNKDGEYYLVENRRFSGWDEGMAQLYPSAATSGEGAQDQGGGLVFWHVDDTTIDAYEPLYQVNNFDHHPGVMPLYLEKDETGALCAKGSSVDATQGVFSASSPVTSLPLPAYGTVPNDTPADRTLSSERVASLDSQSAPVMSFHMHMVKPVVRWADDFSSASLVGLCYVDWGRPTLETTTNIEPRLVKKPSTTEMGILEYTAHFVMDDYEDTTHDYVPLLDEQTINERDAALVELTSLITGANDALTRGAYTTDSFDALRAAIVAANALFEDDTTIPDDVDAAKEQIVRAWRLLEPINALVLEPSEQEREAARRQAACDLAERLCAVSDTVSARDFKPAAYQAFRKVVDGAYEVLKNADASTQELTNAEVELARATALLKKDGKRVPLSAAKVSGLKKATYNGKVHKPSPVVMLAGKKLVVGTDYKVSYARNRYAGKATVTITGMGDYVGKASGTFAIAKAKNPLAAKGKTAKVSYANLRKKARQLAVAKLVRVSKKGKGTMRYAKVSGNAGITINAKTGKTTVRKGLKKGTYKVKIRIKAAGTANYAAATKTLTARIVVR